MLLKLGTYGLVRFWLPVADPSWRVLAPFVAGLAVVGIVYAALACLAQTELKRLIAYSSVGHMGFVVLAVTTFTIGGVQAAVFASVAHGLITGLLFFLAGAIKDRYGTGELDRLHALYGTVPHLGALFAFAAMASLGLPGLAGFWGEMLSIRSALYPDAGAAGGHLRRARGDRRARRDPDLGLLPAADARDAPGHPGRRTPGQRGRRLHRAGHRRGRPRHPDGRGGARDVDTAEWLTWSPLVVLTVVLGVAPGLVLGPVGEAAQAFFGGLG